MCQFHLPHFTSFDLPKTLPDSLKSNGSQVQKDQTQEDDLQTFFCGRFFCQFESREATSQTQNQLRPTINNAFGRFIA